jgi:hypothetical protein
MHTSEGGDRSRSVAAATPDRDVPAALAVVGGTALGLVTMALHPDGTQLLRDLERYGARTVFAHGMAIAGIPLLLLGLFAFTARLQAAGAPTLARLACIVYAMASVAAFNAAVASGFVAPMIAARLSAGSGADSELWSELFRFNWMVNQGFALIFVVGLGVAILLWSVAGWRTGALARWLAVVGVGVGGTLILLILSGRTHLDVHTVGLVVLGQSVWMVGVAMTFLGGGPRRPEA